MPTPGRRATGIPRLPGFDSTLALLSEGYAFVSRRCERLGSDAFETRLGLRKVICARGADAAAMFYHPDRFTRRRAMPPTTMMLLQDKGSVQQLDGTAHRERKRLFLQLLDPTATARMVDLFRDEWSRQATAWTQQARVTLFPEAQLILCRAACRWAGVPLPDAEAPARAQAFGDMIEGAGSFGLKLARGWLQRERTERWIRGVIRQLRAADTHPDISPAAAIAAYRDSDGRRLSTEVAAVELINLLRPTVAVARWIAFAALALHQHSDLRSRLQAGEPRLLYRIVQEVRRFYPFFPAIGGRVRIAFDWHGHRFEPRTWVMLDLYGTDHDPTLWDHPERFDPDRFRAWEGDAFDFIAQGAGDPAQGHRCPGENPAIALLMVATAELALGLRYDVPPQDLSYRMDRLPSLPTSGFVMGDVQRL